MTDTFFSSEFFVANRQKLRQLFTGTAPVVISANGLLQRSADTAFKFQQDANFWYLTGINHPDILLVMDKDKEYLIVPGREQIREAFDGVVDALQLTRASGITQVLDEQEGWRQLNNRVRRAKHVATVSPPPSYIEHYGMYTNPARARLVERLREANDTVELLDIGQHIVRLRMIKQPEEMRALQKAIDITIDGITSVTKAAQLKKYAYEYEIEADLFRRFRRSGAAGHAFDPVVASGLRACTMHNITNNGQLASNDLLVIDVGAEVSYYAADLTRTVSLGVASRRQQAVYDAVLDIQEYAMSLLKPGVIIKDYEATIEKYMGEKLRELGLIKSIQRQDVRRYYPHATSHHLGLNAHDPADYTMPLEPGMVLTIEPGIYISDEAIGVRIEDDVIVTENGIRVLSKRLPRALS